MYLGAPHALIGQNADQKVAERYIVDSERQWATSTTTGDPSISQRILADDFVGIAVDGSSYDKAAQLTYTRDPANILFSNRVNHVKVRFFGDTAVAQGDETWEQRIGTPKRGRYVWTDTWIRRNGKWQIVASEDLVLPE